MTPELDDAPPWLQEIIDATKAQMRAAFERQAKVRARMKGDKQ